MFGVHEQRTAIFAQNPYPMLGKTSKCCNLLYPGAKKSLGDEIIAPDEFLIVTACSPLLA
jgi:hypothetical protein